MAANFLLEDEYEVLMELGKGAYASVYKVKHKKLGYIRALKVSLERVTDEEERQYRQFVSECRVQLKLGNGCHPNIVRVHQPRLIDGHAIVEMDYIDGCTLVSYIEKKKFIDIDTVYRFIHDVVGAMAYCHYDVYHHLMDVSEDGLSFDPEDGSKILMNDDIKARLIEKYAVIHNDLHSNNIMVRYRDGAFVLLDFGLSVQDNKFVKSSARDGGAIEYLSPEKCADRLDDIVITPMSDVYSLGVLLYEVLAGQVPFPCQWEVYTKESAIYKVKEAHKSSLPPVIEPLRREVYEKVNPGKTYQKDYPDWLEDMIMKCLEKKPKDRYKNAKELFDDFNAKFQADKEKLIQVYNEDYIQELKNEIEILNNEKDKLTTNVENKDVEIHLLVTKIRDLNKTISRLEKEKQEQEEQKPIISKPEPVQPKEEKEPEPRPKPIPKINYWPMYAIVGLLCVVLLVVVIKNLFAEAGTDEDPLNVINSELIVENSELIVENPTVVGLTPNWSSLATSEQKRIISQLIDNMVAVKGGRFEMGATSEQGDKYDSDERPTHWVTLSDYHIGKYEVTQEEWQAVMGKNPSYFKGAKRPVEQVSWNDCQEFIRRLNALTGLNFMLPSEAQWEYAARGGNMSKGYKYSGSDTIDNVAWYSSNSGSETYPVGQKQPNELGLYDMSGNVWEWCSDAWYSYDSSSATDPKHKGDTGSYRVYRGGCWNDTARRCRVSFRYDGSPDYSSYDLGLRLVCP